MNVNQGAPGDLALGFWAFTAMTQVQFLVGALTSRKPKKKKEEYESQNRGWEFGMGGCHGRCWLPPTTPMGTSEKREGLYQSLGSEHAGSQARLPGSRHRRGTTEGPSAKKQQTHRRTRHISLLMDFAANQEKNIWFSKQLDFRISDWGLWLCRKSRCLLVSSLTHTQITVCILMIYQHLTDCSVPEKSGPWGPLSDSQITDAIRAPQFI